MFHPQPWTSRLSKLATRDSALPARSESRDRQKALEVSDVGPIPDERRCVLNGLSVVSETRLRSLITTQRELDRVIGRLTQAERLGLDVETELYSPRLCLIQLATETETFMIDPFAMDDLSALRPVFETAEITKVIHNSPFERRILGHVGFDLHGVYDTLTASRRLRGFKLEGGHSLAVVCQRELGVTLSKELQCSNWARRPLSASQLRYAALDAEVLLLLHDRFCVPVGN